MKANSKFKMDEIIAYITDEIVDSLKNMQQVYFNVSSEAGCHTEEEKETLRKVFIFTQSIFNRTEDVVKDFQFLYSSGEPLTSSKIKNGSVKSFITIFCNFVKGNLKKRAESLKSEDAFRTFFNNYFVKEYDALLFVHNPEDEYRFNRMFDIIIALLEKNIQGIEEELHNYVKNFNINQLSEWESPVNRTGYIFLDVESVGFTGEAFAFAVVVSNSKGKILDEKCFFTEHKHCLGKNEDRRWIEVNCYPGIVESYNTEGINPNGVFAEKVSDSATLKKAFEQIYEKYHHGFTIVADCPFPVETNFLASCNFDKTSIPYPVLDLSSILFAQGFNPIGSYKRMDIELPYHHPLADVRQTHRLFFHLANVETNRIEYLNEEEK